MSLARHPPGVAPNDDTHIVGTDIARHTGPRRAPRRCRVSTEDVSEAGSRCRALMGVSVAATHHHRRRAPAEKFSRKSRGPRTPSPTRHTARRGSRPAELDSAGTSMTGTAPGAMSDGGRVRVASNGSDLTGAPSNSTGCRAGAVVEYTRSSREDLINTRTSSGPNGYALHNFSHRLQCTLNGDQV